MPLSTATITFDLADHFGVDYDTLRGIRAWVDTNIPDDTVVDTDGNKVRIGSGKVTVNADGTGSFTVWVPGTGSNPASWQTKVHFEYVPNGNPKAGRTTRTFGPFTITASGDLADLIAEQEVPPEYAGTLFTQLETIRDEAQAARDEAVDISGISTSDAVIANRIETPGSLTETALTNTFAPRVAAVLHSKDYANMAAFFAARNAIAGPAVMVFSPLSSHSGANLRIDQPDTIIQGNGATITLPAGNNQDGIRVGVAAFRLRIENLNLAGAYATQTGTSRGIVFEEYTDPAFRFADRSAIVDCNIDGFLTDGIVVMPMRKNIIIDRTFVRDYGRYGLDLNGPDCRATRCNFGGIRGLYGVRINQSTAWISECGIYSNNTAGILLTNLALGAKVLNNDIDNNYGAGLQAVGVANDALRATIQGNHFRSNSSAGDGLHPDIYLSQVSYLVLSGNYFYNQTGSAWRVTYDVEAGSGVTSITELVNSHETAHVATGRLSTNAAAAMSTRIRRLDLSDAGMSDTTITRVGTNRTPVFNFDTQVQGTVLAARLSVPTTDGSGFLQLVEQSPDASAPSANQARLFARDNGSGKTQLCVRFASGAVQVLSTEP